MGDPDRGEATGNHVENKPAKQDKYEPHDDAHQLRGKFLEDTGKDKEHNQGDDNEKCTAE